MKKYRYILMLLPLLSLCSCDWDDKEEIFPEEYFKVIYLKDSGSRDVVMNTAQDAVIEQMLVMKGGAHPEMSAEGKFGVMSASDAALLWGLAEESVRIIPDESYALPSPVSLTKEAPCKSIDVELYPGKMVSAMKKDPDKTWILPLRLESESGSVNKDNCTILLNCTVNSPLIDWTKTGDETVTIDYKTLDFPISLKITKTEINKVNCSGSLEVLGEEAVSEYNSAHGSSYLLLPSASYTLSEASFSSGKLEGSALLKLSRTGLTSDVEYLLPIRIKTVASDLFDITDEVKYCIVRNPKFAYADVEPTKWKIAFSNSEYRNSEYWASNMLNRNPASNFCSYWSTKQTRIGADVDDFRYPVEGTYPGTCTYTSGDLAGETIAVPYPCCDGVRKYDNVVVVIDLGETVNIHSIGLSKMAGSTNNLDLKGVEFYTEDQFTLETAAQYKDSDVTKYRAAIANYSTANAGNNWRLFMQWSVIPKGTALDGLPTVWNTTPSEYMNTASAKGRYLKIHPTASYRSSLSCIEICDLYIRKLITIDGEPAQ